MEQVQTAAEALVRLEQPFASKDVKWLVAATSKDGRKGRVTPYADPRAYTDRLNLVFTASGWTREYTVQTLAPITRLKNDKPIQSGKVLVTCVVSIPSVGAHSGCGEQWAEDPNALTSAEAQAFKRACSNFGLGRYLYRFGEMWVDIDEFKRPREFPALPSWALPENERRNASTANTNGKSSGNGTASVQKGPLDASVNSRGASRPIPRSRTRVPPPRRPRSRDPTRPSSGTRRMPHRGASSRCTSRSPCARSRECR